MRKSAVNYWLFVALALLAILLAVSAIMLWIVFPRGYFPDRVLWVDIHKWGGLALTICVLLHIALHWRWAWQMTRYYNRRVFRCFRSRNEADGDPDHGPCSDESVETRLKSLHDSGLRRGE